MASRDEPNERFVFWPFFFCLRPFGFAVLFSASSARLSVALMDVSGIAERIIRNLPRLRMMMYDYALDRTYSFLTGAAPLLLSSTGAGSDVSSCVSSLAFFAGGSSDPSCA